MRREFLQLAHTFKPGKHVVKGWIASPKVDGMRAFWDGGYTRNMHVSEVPFANMQRDSREHVCTGLWSRYGKVIHCPSWFLDQLPAYPLDGELWMGRGKFQNVMSVCRAFEKNHEWRNVKFVVFDAPVLEEVCVNGTVNNPNYSKEFSGVLDWYKGRGYVQPRSVMTYGTIMHWLLENLDVTENLDLIPHCELPIYTDEASEALTDLLMHELEKGGEGVMLRNPRSFWSPKRTETLLKVKDMKDSEGVVTGYTFGRETDRGSKLMGLMGALILDWRGKQFELSGFTDAERELIDPKGEAYDNPGKVASHEVTSSVFPRGSKVTFRYRELTDAGLPKEARYFRKV